MKIAYQHPREAGAVIIANADGALPAARLGSVIDKPSARSRGYTVKPIAQAPNYAKSDWAGTLDAEAGAIEPPNRSYLYRVMSLPEAEARPAAATLIATTKSDDTMPIETVAAFLRGLPAETAKAAAPSPALSPGVAERFSRKWELHINALNHNAAKGNVEARKQAQKMTTALHLHRSEGFSVGDAFKSVGLDAEASVKKIGF